MKKTVLLYGTLLALLTWVLQVLEYKFWMRDLSTEAYIALIAIFFTALGVWAGLRLTRKTATARQPIFNTLPPQIIPAHMNLSKRELEVLALIAEGLSNQEIAERLFVSLNTVKTHSSNLFEKLGVRRRTQAIQRAKELGLL